MKLFSTPRSAALCTLAIMLIVIGVFGLFVGQTVAAAAAPFAGPWHGGNSSWARDNLPPELTGLADVPAADRFGHFRGVQITLTDRTTSPYWSTSRPAPSPPSPQLRSPSTATTAPRTPTPWTARRSRTTSARSSRTTRWSSPPSTTVPLPPPCSRRTTTAGAPAAAAVPGTAKAPWVGLGVALSS